MATAQKFEDLICWQKARELTREIYKSLNDETFKRLNLRPDYGLKDQIQRAAVSVMSNISEGFERGTQAEFINYLFIAKGSAGEVRNQLYVALDNGYLSDETFLYGYIDYYYNLAIFQGNQRKSKAIAAPNRFNLVKPCFIKSI